MAAVTCVECVQSVQLLECMYGGKGLLLIKRLEKVESTRRILYL